DSNKVGITPIWNYSLTTGVHVLKLINSKYPTSYIEKINIIPGDNKVVKINLNDYVGYLKCEVYPFGYIYINGKLIGTTPIDSIMLSPGNYSLAIKNENYSPIGKEITITAKQTFTYKLNFEELKR
ncbi:MAG: PEGA domain-containing protein, partial [Bacteroidetes bacterium]|nr:PEGA domain-containing protein [Bacteroidota bacterium]